MARSVSRLLVLALLAAPCTGCAAKREPVFEQLNPSWSDESDAQVVRVEKHPNRSILDLGEPEPRCEGVEIGEAEVHRMMSALEWRFFADPTYREDQLAKVSEGVVGAVAGSFAGDLVGSLFGDDKNKKADHAPPLSVNAPPESMSKARPVFTPEQIEVLAPEISRGLGLLERLDYLVVQVNAKQGESSDSRDAEGEDFLEAFVSCDRPAFGGGEAWIEWDFVQLEGLEFRGRPDAKVGGYTWRPARSATEHWDFLAVLPQREDPFSPYHKVIFGKD